MEQPEISLTDLESARRRGVTWLLDHMGDDGRPAGAEEGLSAYRLPWALLEAGERGAASAALSWLEANALDERGDLRPEATERWTTCGAPYPLATIAAAAWLLRRFDTCEAILDVLEADYVDPVRGGAYDLRPEVRGDSTRQDIYPTAQLGYTALLAGRRELARQVYECLDWVYSEQESLPRYLCTAWDANGLITERREGDFHEVVSDFQAPSQAYFNPGISAAFLGQYAAATGDMAPFALADSFLAVNAAGTDSQFDLRERQLCKYSWGASVMLELAPNGLEYLPVVRRMGAWILACQDPEGSWRAAEYLIPDPSDAIKVEVTSEFLMCLGMVLAALRGCDRPRLEARPGATVAG